MNLDVHTPDLVYYRIHGQIRNIFPGAHTGRQPGQGFIFREHDTLIRSREHRRIDVHATLRNPMGEIMVRRFNQKSSINLQVIADLSGSMATPAESHKLETMKELVLSLAYSARAYGDKFGLTSCNDTVVSECTLPCSMDISNIDQIVEEIANQRLRGGSVGLGNAHEFIDGKQGLVFLVSDFLFPQSLLETTLQSLSRHSIIPVVLGAEYTTLNLGKFGFTSYTDSESGNTRSVFLRKSVINQYRENCIAFYSKLDQFFTSMGIRPVFLGDGFDAEALNEYFHP